MGISLCPLSTKTASLIDLALPNAFNESMAALIVRPVYKTSSTSTTILSSKENEISVPCT